MRTDRTQQTETTYVILDPSVKIAEFIELLHRIEMMHGLSDRYRMIQFNERRITIMCDGKEAKEDVRSLAGKSAQVFEITGPQAINHILSLRGKLVGIFIPENSATVAVWKTAFA